MKHQPTCAREVLRQADDSAAYLSERCTCAPTAVEDSGRSAPEGWQPIATAPLDGRSLLLYGCEVNRHLFGWGHYFKGVPGDGEGWIAHSFYAAPIDDVSCSFTPTHWMPLPAPPRAALLVPQEEQ